MTGETLWQTSLDELLDRTAAARPAPGGGAVTLMSAALALGLVLMSLRVSRRYRSDTGELDRLVDQGQDLLERLKRGAVDDVEAFQGLLRASRQAQAADQAPLDSARQLAEAVQAAIDAPLNASRLCSEAIELAAQAHGLVADELACDVEAAVALLEGAGHGALCVVDTNLKRVQDPERAQRLFQERTLQAESVHNKSESFRALVDRWEDD